MYLSSKEKILYPIVISGFFNIFNLKKAFNIPNSVLYLRTIVSLIGRQSPNVKIYFSIFLDT